MGTIDICMTTAPPVRHPQGIRSRLSDARQRIETEETDAVFRSRPMPAVRCINKVRSGAVDLVTLDEVATYDVHDFPRLPVIIHSRPLATGLDIDDPSSRASNALEIAASTPRSDDDAANCLGFICLKRPRLES